MSPIVPLLAVTVIGSDRPGIIADVTGVLARLGGNLEDSTMTLLGGHFAMMLLVDVDADAPAVEGALETVAEPSGLLASVRAVPADEGAPAAGVPYLLTVHGADRPGIVSAMTRLVADVGGNVTDLTTRLSDGLYLLVAEVDLPEACDVAALRQRLAARAEEIGVDAGLRPADEDVL